MHTTGPVVIAYDGSAIAHVTPTGQILGSRGRPGLRAALLDCTSTAVLHRSTRPTLVGSFADTVVAEGSAGPTAPAA